MFLLDEILQGCYRVPGNKGIAAVWELDTGLPVMLQVKGTVSYDNEIQLIPGQCCNQRLVTKKCRA